MRTTAKLLLATAVAVSAVRADASEIYTPHGGGSNLGTIDTATGLGSDVGSFGLPGFPTVANSAAFDFDAQRTLYTIVNTLGTADTVSAYLATIDVTTGAVIQVAPAWDMNLLAMEIEKSGRMLAVGDTSGELAGVPPEFQTFGDTTLYEVDKTTGQLTSLVDLGIPAMMDLAIDSQGVIFGTTRNVLYTIDASVGVTHQVAITGVAAGEIMGIMFDEADTLFATAFTEDSPLFTIDPASGVATAYGGVAMPMPTGLVLPHGGDIRVAVPEPASVTLTLLAALGAVAGRRRARNR